MDILSCCRSQLFFAEDNYLELRPEILLGYQLINWLSVSGSFAYDIASGVDLIGTTANDLSGINLSLSLRVSVINYE